MIYNIEFHEFQYIKTLSDGIDSDRYIIPFTLVTKNNPPLQDNLSKHKITIEITGSILASASLWNCKEIEIPKIIFAHAFEHIKSLITLNKLSTKNYFNLDAPHLSKYHVDPNKIPEIDKYKFNFEIEDPKKTFGFRTS
jgi:hypothetical protein